MTKKKTSYSSSTRPFAWVGAKEEFCFLLSSPTSVSGSKYWQRKKHSRQPALYTSAEHGTTPINTKVVDNTTTMASVLVIEDWRCTRMSSDTALHSYMQPPRVCWRSKSTRFDSPLDCISFYIWNWSSMCDGLIVCPRKC